MSKCIFCGVEVEGENILDELCPRCWLEENEGSFQDWEYTTGDGIPSDDEHGHCDECDGEL